LSDKLAQVYPRRAFVVRRINFIGKLLEPEFDVNSPKSEAEFGKLPSLPMLFGQYLEKQTAARAAGLAEAGPAEVVPFDAVPLQPVDPKAAWNSALEAARFFGNGATSMPTVPPSWPQLVAQCEPELALPFCLGNYPQLVRTLAPFIEPTDLVRLRPTGARARRNASVDEDPVPANATNHPVQPLLSAALFRLMKDFDRATDVLQKYADKVPAEYRAAWVNEEAALAWQGGRAEAARASWESQPDSAPVLFNRGLAALFSDRTADARSLLKKAISQISDDSPWYHLGSFYIAVAETKLAE
jgi:tetratricopeptide (TPR) repeat protein